MLHVKLKTKKEDQNVITDTSAPAPAPEKYSEHIADSLTKEANLKFKDIKESDLTNSVGMSFSAEQVNANVEEIKEGLENIKNVYAYDSDEDRNRALNSMILNGRLIIGNYYCTTHKEKHLGSYKDLEKLSREFGCKSFAPVKQ